MQKGPPGYPGGPFNESLSHPLRLIAMILLRPPLEPPSPWETPQVLSWAWFSPPHGPCSATLALILPSSRPFGIPQLDSLGRYLPPETSAKQRLRFLSLRYFPFRERLQPRRIGRSALSGGDPRGSALPPRCGGFPAAQERDEVEGVGPFGRGRRDFRNSGLDIWYILLR
jgi:hypothetical protein